MALCALMAGCSFISGHPRERPVITSNDPGLKIPAIKKAATARDSQTARQLVKSLDSDDPAVRFYAIRGLQSLTGETFGYVWYSDEPERRGSTEHWKKWLDANADSLAGAPMDGGK
jgi:hypothetical protein